MDTATTLTRLREVLRFGDPAQQGRARELIDALSADPLDQQSLGAAALLIDAYLNDPYLTR